MSHSCRLKNRCGPGETGETEGSDEVWMGETEGFGRVCVEAKLLLECSDSQTRQLSGLGRWLRGRRNRVPRGFSRLHIGAVVDGGDPRIRLARAYGVFMGVNEVRFGDPRRRETWIPGNGSMVQEVWNGGLRKGRKGDWLV